MPKSDREGITAMFIFDNRVMYDFFNSAMKNCVKKQFNDTKNGTFFNSKLIKTVEIVKK